MLQPIIFLSGTLLDLETLRAYILNYMSTHALFLFQVTTFARRAILERRCSSSRLDKLRLEHKSCNFLVRDATVVTTYMHCANAMQVVGGPDDSIVFVTLKEGVCFGEIALLGSEGTNRLKLYQENVF